MESGEVQPQDNHFTSGMELQSDLSSDEVGSRRSALASAPPSGSVSLEHLSDEEAVIHRQLEIVDSRLEQCPDNDEQMQLQSTRATLLRQLEEAQAEQECSICLQPMGEEACELGCRHSFHRACISGHILAKCRQAERSVRDELSSFAVPGVSMAELLTQNRIRQCPQCGYGPVLNTRCADLASHDVQHGQGADRVTNSCGACGFFSREWDDWAVWDPACPFAAARCPLCNKTCQLSAETVTELQAEFQQVRGSLRDALVEAHDANSLAADLVVFALFLMAEQGNFCELAGAEARRPDLEMALRLGRRSRELLQHLGGLQLCSAVRGMLAKNEAYRRNLQQQLMAAAEAVRPSSGMGGPRSRYEHIQAIMALRAAMNGTPERRNAACRGQRGEGAEVAEGQAGGMDVDAPAAGARTSSEQQDASAQRPARGEGVALLAAPRLQVSCEELLHTVLDFEPEPLPSAEEEEARCAKLLSDAERKRDLALLLCCGKEHLAPEVACTLGRPWAAQICGGPTTTELAQVTQNQLQTLQRFFEQDARRFMERYKDDDRPWSVERSPPEQSRDAQTVDGEAAAAQAAIRNYARFHNISEELVSLRQIRSSCAGVLGWAQARLDDSEESSGGSSSSSSSAAPATPAPEEPAAVPSATEQEEALRTERRQSWLQELRQLHIRLCEPLLDEPFLFPPSPRGRWAPMRAHGFAPVFEGFPNNAQVQEWLVHQPGAAIEAAVHAPVREPPRIVQLVEGGNPPWMRNPNPFLEPPGRFFGNADAAANGPQEQLRQQPPPPAAPQLPEQLQHQQRPPPPPHPPEAEGLAVEPPPRIQDALREAPAEAGAGPRLPPPRPTAPPPSNQLQTMRQLADMQLMRVPPLPPPPHTFAEGLRDFFHPAPRPHPPVAPAPPGDHPAAAAAPAAPVEGEGAQEVAEPEQPREARADDTDAEPPPPPQRQAQQVAFPDMVAVEHRRLAQVAQAAEEEFRHPAVRRATRHIEVMHAHAEAEAMFDWFVPRVGSPGTLHDADDPAERAQAQQAQRSLREQHRRLGGQRWLCELLRRLAREEGVERRRLRRTAAMAVAGEDADEDILVRELRRRRRFPQH